MQNDTTGTKCTIETYPAAIREWQRTMVGPCPEPPDQPLSYWDTTRLFSFLKIASQLGDAISESSPRGFAARAPSCLHALMDASRQFSDDHKASCLVGKGGDFLLGMLTEALEAWRESVRWSDAVARRGQGPEIGKVPILVTEDRLRGMPIADIRLVRTLINAEVLRREEGSPPRS